MFIIYHSDTVDVILRVFVVIGPLKGGIRCRGPRRPRSLRNPKARRESTGCARPARGRPRQKPPILRRSPRFPRAELVPRSPPPPLLRRQRNPRRPPHRAG